MRFAYLLLSLLLFTSIKPYTSKQDLGIHALHKAKQLEYACNRGIIESMTPAGMYFSGFEIMKSDPMLKQHCKQIELSCCTESELRIFLDQQSSKKEEFKIVEEYVQKLIGFLEIIDTEKLQEMMKPTSIQSTAKNEFAIEDVESYLDKLKNQSDKALIGLAKLKTAYFDYFSGIMCTICDAKKNLFMHDFETNKDKQHILKIELNELGCLNNFKRQTEYIDLIQFIYTYLELAQFFEHNDNGELILSEGFDNSYYQEQKELFDKCISLENGKIFGNEDCQEACLVLNNLVNWESFEFFYVLDRVYYIINVKYGDEGDSLTQKEFEERVTQLEKFYDIAPAPYFNLRGEQDGTVSTEGLNINDAIPINESVYRILTNMFGLLLLFMLF